MATLFNGTAPDGSPISAVFGLTWRTVAMGDPVHVARTVAKKSKASHMTLPTDKGSYAAVKLKISGKHKTALYSAARIVGQSFGTAFVALELPDQRIWTCWTKDGTPVHDEVVSLSASAVTEKYQDYCSLEGFHDCHVYVSNENILEGPKHERLAFEDLFTLAVKDKTVVLEPLVVSSINPKVMAMLLAVIVGGGGYYAYQKYEKAQKQLRLKAQQQAAPPVNAGALYEANLKQWFGTRMGHNNDALAALRAYIGKLPASPGGWAMDSIQCDAQTAAWVCLVDYKRKQPGATNQSLSKALTQDVAVTYKSFTQASGVFQVKAASPKLAATDVLSIQSHESSTVSALQAIDTAFSLATLKPYQKLELPAVKNADGTAIAMPAGILLPQQREVGLTGPVRNIDLIVAKALPIAWTKAAFTLSDGATPSLKSSYAMVNLTGVFYGK